MFSKGTCTLSAIGSTYNNSSASQASGYKISYSTQISMKFIMLINVKMSTVVRILTFISMINTPEKFKARKVYFQHLIFISNLNEHEKSFITLKPLDKIL